MAVDSEEYDADVTELVFPIHGIIEEIPQLTTEFENINDKKLHKMLNSNKNTNKIGTENEIDEILRIKTRNLECLFHLCVSANMLNQLRSPLNNHVLMTVIDSMSQLDAKFALKAHTHRQLIPFYTKLFEFMQKMFDTIIHEPSFVDNSIQTLRARNKLFVNKEMLKVVKRNLDVYRRSTMS